MTRAVVTGASGFLGGAVVHALRSRGDDVVGLDRRRGPGVVLADTSRPGGWERFLPGADLLVHAAAIGTGGFADPSPVAGPAVVGRDSAALLDPDEVWRNNVDGTATVLAAARRADIPRVVHLSSISALAGVDASPPAGPLAEDVEPPHTGNVLTDALAAAEREARIDSRAPWVVVARVGDAYGPRAGRWTLRPVALMRAGRFALVDGGRGLLSPIHVEDVAEGVLALAETKAALGQVVNLSGATAVPASAYFGQYARMLELDGLPSVSATVARGLAGLTGRSFLPAAGPRGGLTGRLASLADPRVRFDIGAASVAELTRQSTFSIARIGELAGWRPRFDLDAGMARTEQMLRERGLLGVREPTRRG
ncbi:MAG: NAD-dependent epimerase/dehydratase family protein [Frankia sp.]